MPWETWAMIVMLTIVGIGGLLIMLTIFFTGRKLPDIQGHEIGDITDDGLLRNVVGYL